MASTAQKFLRPRACRFLAPAVLALLLFFSAQARAGDPSPFDLESSSWMSFDRYKDKPANWLTPDQRDVVAAQPVVVPPPVLPASMPVREPPARPIVEPVMPGLNRNFDIKVDSTEDDHRLPIIQPDASKGTTTETQLPESQWKDAADVARKEKKPAGAADDSNASAFNVRYTALPAWLKETHKKAVAMTPVPAPSTLAPVKIAQPFAPPPPAPPPAPAMSPADAAACAALEAYKKRQLAAIESDRQTLTALQNAIAQLGLQKQLDFMPDVGGSLNAQAAQGVTVPAATVPAKN